MKMLARNLNWLFRFNRRANEEHGEHFDYCNAETFRILADIPSDK